MKITPWIVVILMLFVTASYSQEVMEFTQYKFFDNNKTVYFHIKGLGEDEEARSVLLEDIIQDENVINGRIFTSSSYKTRCQLNIPLNITPEYIRAILNSHGYDYDFTTISVNGELKEYYNPETFVSVFSPPTENFPKLQITGDNAQDKENYAVAKEQWISENQRKYKKEKAKGTAQFPIVIKQEEFESYTLEKQQRLLAEPDKYIIK